MKKIIMHTWYGTAAPRPGHRYGEEITAETYEADMAQNREWRETVHVWEGTDRSGSPLTVAWVPEPRFGVATLYAYEITGGE